MDLDDVGSPDMNISELNSIYRQADASDFDILSEMRSNILLCAGEHYTKRNARFWSRVRDNQNLTEEMRIRLTKNHLNKICKIYSNNIMSYTPGCQAMPKDETDLHDQKAADLHNAVMEDAKDRHNLDDVFCEACDDFTQVGEVHFYVYWDPNKGTLKGYQPDLDDDGEPILDESGTPSPDKTKPVHTGDLIAEKVYGFNLRRAPEVETFEESPYIILNRMAHAKDLRKIYKNDRDKLQYVQPTSSRTFRVFDAITGVYRPAEPTEILVRYYFFKPCLSLPEGYFYLATEAGILEEGPLPFGVFPIVNGYFERIPTTPRGRSIIKQLRPYQAEINRVASKIAEHQITLGDDKLIFQGQVKISSGAAIPGIRTVQAAGAPPIVLPGRTGDQYVGYMDGQIKEMYSVADIDVDQPDNKQVDPYSLLQKSASQRKKFVRYSKRFERVMVKFWDLYLTLAKKYFTDDMLIRAVGKREQINISEFRSYDNLSYEIKVEPSNEDIETKVGKQLVLSQALQYVGPNMQPDQVGQLIRAMPYGNKEEAIGDLLLDYDVAKNVMLALDRGEQAQPMQYDNHPYMIKKLTSRMRQADFKFMNPQIQQSYAMLVQAHMQFQAQAQQQIQMQEAQMIPTSGTMVKADLYVNNPQNPNAVTRITLPEDALKWLMQKLQIQGVNTQQQTGLPMGARAQVAGMVHPNPGMPPQQGGPMPGAPPPHPMMPPMQHPGPPQPMTPQQAAS